MISEGKNILCPMCGTSFEPGLNSSCPSCPLQKGCQMVCCPVCGYQSVMPERSEVARFAARMIEAAQNAWDQGRLNRMWRDRRWVPLVIAFKDEEGKENSAGE